MEQIHVATSSRPYDVLVGAGLLDHLGELVRDVTREGRCCVVTETNVGPLYADRVEAALGAAGLDVAGRITFPAGEASKTLATLGGILEDLAERELTRDDVVVALGGGVTGDMGGLAAALYLRGIKVVQVPTSLLAMVDSSVGGKTAVDLAAGKNLVGAFWQPSLVVADVDALATVPPERTHAARSSSTPSSPTPTCSTRSPHAPSPRAAMRPRSSTSSRATSASSATSWSPTSARGAFARRSTSVTPSAMPSSRRATSRSGTAPASPRVCA